MKKNTFCFYCGGFAQIHFEFAEEEELKEKGRAALRGKFYMECYNDDCDIDIINYNAIYAGIVNWDD